MILFESWIPDQVRYDKKRGLCHVRWIYDEINESYCWEQPPNLFGVNVHLKIRKRFNGFVRFAWLRLLPNPAYIS